METRISDEDLEHLQGFPDSRKAAVMKRVMAAREPAESVVLEGDGHFETAIVRLRRDGYGLIELQRQETAFSTVWYRRSGAVVGHAGPEVAMLLWEARDCGDATTLMKWRV